MECRNCPYIRDEYELRYSYDDTEEYCWCDKTGGKLWLYGRCTDAISDAEHNRDSMTKQKTSTKRSRYKKYQRHLKYLSENNCGKYPTPSFPVDKYGKYNEDDIAYYKRVYRSTGRNSVSRCAKKESNRAVRRNKTELYNGGRYKKLYDYWYTIY